MFLYQQSVYVCIYKLYVIFYAFSSLNKSHHFVHIILQLLAFPLSLVLNLDMVKCIIVIHLLHDLYLHSFVDGHLGFQYFVIINSAKVNIGVICLTVFIYWSFSR